MPDWSTQHSFKLQPAVPKLISAIDPANDARVRVLGCVIDVSDNTFLLDDGTGSAQVLNALEKTVMPNERVRVFARVFARDDRFELHAEVIQPMNSLDENLHRKVMQYR